MFSDYKPGTSLTFTRFEDYWGEKPFFEVIDWRFVTDETAALNGLQAGEYDFVTAVLAEGIERVATFSEDPEFTVLFESSGEVSYMWLNTEVEAFQDARVRQAIAHAINRDEAIEVYDRYAYDDLSDGGPLRRALQRRLLPVRVRPRGGHGPARRSWLRGPRDRLSVHDGGVAPVHDGSAHPAARRRRHHGQQPCPGPHHLDRPGVYRRATTR